MGLFKICYCCILFVFAPYNNMKIAVYNIFINFKSSNKGIFHLGKHNGISLDVSRGSFHHIDFCLLIFVRWTEGVQCYTAK